MRIITRRSFVSLMATSTILTLVGCAKPSGDAADPSSGSAQPSSSERPAGSSSTEEGSVANAEGRALVAYFSCTGTTQRVAEYAAEALGAQTFRIQPLEPYTDDDLAYYTDCRADREQADESARPHIAGDLPDLSGCSTVILGYPIWHGQAPRIISTFLESCNLAGKTIVPFCTSHSSGMGSSASNLEAAAPDANWLSGRRFGPDATKEEVSEWLAGA